MTIQYNNLVDEFIANSAAIFSPYFKELGLKEVFKDDVLLIPTMPSLAISCTSFWNDLKTIGSTNVRYEFSFIGNLWYYHSALNEDLHVNLIMRNAYRIAEHVIKNASLNGWLINTRAMVRSCAFVPRRRSGTILAAARITYMAPYQLRVDQIS
jgi:hypothetical protein